MKFQHDLRYGTLEDETLNYIWSDSKGLRETLIKADTTPTQAELNEARQMFKTRIYEYLENGATLTNTLVSLQKEINDTLYRKREVLQKLSEKNAELFAQNLLFQSLTGFQTFMTTKRFLDIMKNPDYDERISKRNRREDE